MDHGYSVINALIARITKHLNAFAQRALEASHTVDRLTDSRQHRVQKAVFAVKIPDQLFGKQGKPIRKTRNIRPSVSEGNKIRSRIRDAQLEGVNQISICETQLRQSQLAVFEQCRKGCAAEIAQFQVCGVTIQEPDISSDFQDAVRAECNGRYRLKARCLKRCNNAFKIRQTIVQFKPHSRFGQFKRFRIRATRDRNSNRFRAQQTCFEIKKHTGGGIIFGCKR